MNFCVFTTWLEVKLGILTLVYADYKNKKGIERALCEGSSHPLKTRAQRLEKGC